MDCGVITSKTVLLLISLIFWAAAAGLAYVGGYVLDTYRIYDPFFQDKYALLPAVVIICVAVVMFIIGLIGCCATIRESKVGLGVFLFIILMIFIAEVAAFVLGFIYRGKVKTDLHEPMQEAFRQYDGKTEGSRLIDYLQKELQCCGIHNYTDWVNSSWYNSTGNHSIPVSCCKQAFKTNCTGQLSEPQFLSTKGCEDKLVTVLQSVLSYAMLVILGFAIVKFFGMLSVCVLTCKRENNDYQPLNSGVFA
ncbi:tetraspanin-36-like [Hemicordylus capensis]|uniref:tetraspanin-36-like n=1 Tax=Hemicordylus capensis TaxID=884348 RepID=UPI0023033146|nr:tetraspanin-36-like [Hemicordylus capensis]